MKTDVETKNLKEDNEDDGYVYDPNTKMGTAEAKLEKRIDRIKKIEVEIVYLRLTFKSPINEFKWEITKTLLSLRNFASRIQFELTNKNLSIPSQRFTNIMKMIIEYSYDQLKTKEEDLKEFINLFGDYLPLKNSIFVHEYLEVSKHSFLASNNGIKPKEGYIMKQAEFNHCQRSCISLAKCFRNCCCLSYIKCWFLLKKDMLCYIDDSQATIGKGTFWFDKGVAYAKKGMFIKLSNEKMKVKLKFQEEFDRDIWYELIKMRVDDFKANIQHNIYDSFASEKNECRAKWYVDGEDYFKELHMKLLQAKETIFITDWWMSPEVFLIRPLNVNQYKTLKQLEPLTGQKEQEISRLCDLLNYLAKKGVKIYVLLYCEVSVALDLGSKHTKQFLKGLDSNINVTRHPRTSFDLLWTHHEKLVVIDQRVAFIGGLDLCWGRYDNHDHPIAEAENKDGFYLFPGIDYSNARTCDFANVDQYLKESVNRTSARMPWHDIHSMIEGPAALDISRHFIERWNYAKSPENKEGITDIKTKFQRETIKGQTGETLILSQPQKTIRLSDFHLEDNKNNGYDKEIEEANFDKVNPNANLKKKDNQEPKKEGAYSKFKMHIKKKIIKKTNETKLKLIENCVNLSAYRVKFQKDEKRMICQCLRSLSFWSGGLERTEHSILNAYTQLIDNAQHYIYIENQFFISKPFTSEENQDKQAKVSDLVINEIALRLYLRIKKAFIQKDKFKVMVFLPLLPGFAGEIQNASTLQAILKYTYNTISRNNGLSLVEKLIALLGNQYNQYIRFYSLRQHGMVNGVASTELIYIHSKLMIVDDLYVIMGSANINDRSMMGDRDSEFAVLYKENPPEFDLMMNGKKVKSSFFASTLRMKVLTEHLGITINDQAVINHLFDPLSDQLLDHINSLAKSNTEIYREVFNCYPDDKMTSFKDIPLPKVLSTEEKNQLNKKYLEKNKQIVGHIVEFPLFFLENELLQRSIFSAEILLPLKFFT